MAKLMTTKYSAGAFNGGMLLLRLIAGILIMNHGYDKLVHFGDMQNKFINFMGIGTTASLALAVFAEFFCGLFIVIGLFTRLAAIPLIITMLVAIIKAHNALIFTEAQTATLFLAAFFTILILGPGKVSVDGMTGK